MPSELAVGVFARAPLAGRTKTRLVPALGAEGAARLYAAFLEDTLARFEQATIFCASPDDRAWFTERHPDRALELQPPGDLGHRMEAALAHLHEHASRAVLIGSDAPTLPFARVSAASAALADADVVLGPAADGGYYLIGSRAPAPTLGPAVRWSTRHALADTVAAVARAGRRALTLGPWYDIDTPEDLRLLRAHLGVRPADAPATARALFDRGGGA